MVVYLFSIYYTTPTIVYTVQYSKVKYERKRGTLFITKRYNRFHLFDIIYEV